MLRLEAAEAPCMEAAIPTRMRVAPRVLFHALVFSFSHRSERDVPWMVAGRVPEPPNGPSTVAKPVSAFALPTSGLDLPSKWQPAAAWSCLAVRVLEEPGTGVGFGTLPGPRRATVNAMPQPDRGPCRTQISSLFGACHHDRQSPSLVSDLNQAKSLSTRRCEWLGCLCTRRLLVGLWIGTRSSASSR